jgi:hypothetical protein
MCRATRFAAAGSCSALLARLPGSDPFADARVGDAFVAVKRRKRFGDAGDLPLIGVEIGGNRLGREERTGAAGILSELFKTAFGRTPNAN